MNGESARVADLARLSFLLGELYAEAVLNAQRRFSVNAELVGCHGQTLYHQGEPRPFMGRTVAATWQTGEGAIVAARVGVPAVSDFRPSDMAAGGKGAPLVPYLDFLLFRDPKIGRILQNVGGIANLTEIPAGPSTGNISAFDTDPGNMVIDAVTETLFGRPFDRDGKIAAEGLVLKPVLEQILKRKFFRAKPPKTAGREEFGREFVGDFLRQCAGFRKEDLVATATALTARSIGDAVRRFIIHKPGSQNAIGEMILSGGGARNATLVAMLAAAALVKVRQRIFSGATPASRRLITRCANTWVLPEPALAATHAETPGSETSPCRRSTSGGMMLGDLIGAFSLPASHGAPGISSSGPPVLDHSLTRARWS